MLTLQQHNSGYTQGNTPGTIKEIEIDKIQQDPRVRARAEINPKTVDEYSKAMQTGCHFPAVIVFFDDQDYWLAAGFIRTAAVRKIGKDKILAEIRSGNLRDAILFSSGENEEHGLKRSNVDRRRSVIRLFADEQLSRMSNTAIAKACKVGESLVRRIELELSPFKTKIDELYLQKCGVDLETLQQAQQNLLNRPDELEVRRRGKTYTMNSRNIGRNQPQLTAVAETSSNQTVQSVVVKLPPENLEPLEEIAFNSEPDSVIAVDSHNRALPPSAPLPEIIEDLPVQAIEHNPDVTGGIAESEVNPSAMLENSDAQSPEEIAHENSKRSTPNDIELVLATADRIEELNIKSEILLKGNMTPITGQVERVFVNWQAANGEQGGSWFPLKLLDIVGVKIAG